MPSRHHGLLATGSGRLFELVLLAPAKRDRGRRDCAAFRDAVERRPDRYDELMGDLRWKLVEGEFRLVVFGREDAIARELDFLIDLWESLVALQDEPAKAHVELTRRKAREWGYDELVAVQHVSRALNHMAGLAAAGLHRASPVWAYLKGGRGSSSVNNR